MYAALCSVLVLTASFACVVVAPINELELQWTHNVHTKFSLRLPCMMLQSTNRIITLLLSGAGGEIANIKYNTVNESGIILPATYE